MEAKRFTIQQRLSAIELAKQTSNYKAAEEYRVDPSTIRYWRSKENEYVASNIKQLKSLNKGKEPESIKFEKELVNWILNLRKEGYAVNVMSVIKMTLSLDANFKLKNMTKLKKWCYKFLKRHHFTFRKLYM